MAGDSVTVVPLQDATQQPQPHSRLGEHEQLDEAALVSDMAGLPHRVAALQGHTVRLQPAGGKSRVVGKRKQRRRENSNLSSLAEEIGDAAEGSPLEETAAPRRAIFPVPPPAAFARTAPAAGIRKPTPDPRSAQMGRYLLSMKGIQRRLRTVLKTQSRTADLVRLIEKEIIDWVYQVQVWSPEDADQQQQQRTRVIDATLPPTDELDAPSIVELERRADRLKWEVREPFDRFLVHLTARLWEVASFSRTEADGRRLTTLLRPNTVHGDPHAARGAPGAFATPPTTEWEASSLAGSMLMTSDSELSDWAAQPDEADGEQQQQQPLSPWQVISRDAAWNADSDQEAEGDATFVGGADLQRVVSLSSNDAESEDEVGSMADSVERLRV